MFELRQITAGRRVVRLLRPTASPLVGAEWGVRQRGDVRWPFGSNSASALFGGSEEIPTDFTFRWFTRDLAVDRSAELVGTGPITDADALVDLFRDIVRERSPVIVRWRHREALAKLSEFRAVEGFIGEYEPVTLKVEWLQPDRLPKETLPKPTNAVRDAIRSVLRGYAEVLGQGQMPLTIGRAALIEVERTLTDVSLAFDDTARLVKAYTGRGGESPELIGGVARSMANIGERAQDLIASVATSAGEMSGVEGSRELTEAAFFRAVIQRSAAVAWRRATIERLTLEFLDTGDIIAIVRAVAGTDLRVIALQHYGHIEGWQGIASFNGLSGSTLTEGRRIRVPRQGFFL